MAVSYQVSPKITGFLLVIAGWTDYSQRHNTLITTFFVRLVTKHYQGT